MDIREEGALKRSLGLWRSFRVNTEVAGFGVKQIDLSHFGNALILLA